MSTSITTELLARVSEIKKKYDLIADVTGERFNVFGILGLETSETRTHSAFLHELLNPQGSHGLKDTFLREFISMLKRVHGHSDCAKLDSWDAISLLKAKVDPEVWIGCKTEDCSEGGRIDLVIDPGGGGRRIFIENKIRAGDQLCQMVRYHNYDKYALLIYLTPDGKPATPFSTKNRETNQDLKPGEDYFQISYEEDILNWLEECRKQASNYPLVRETIVQYINLIRNLTQQNPSNKMSEEIVNAVLRDNNKEYFEAFCAIRNAEQGIKAMILADLTKKLTAVGAKLGLECNFEFFDIYGAKEQGCYFSTEAMRSRNLNIAYQNRENQFRDWTFGFCQIKLEDQSLQNPMDLDRLRSVYENVIDKVQSFPPWWLACSNAFYPYWNDETFSDIHYGTFVDEFATLLEKHVRVAKESGLA